MPYTKVIKRGTLEATGCLTTNVSPDCACRLIGEVDFQAPLEMHQSYTFG